MTTLCVDIGKSLVVPALSMANLEQPGLAELLEAIALAENRRPAAGRHGPFGMTSWMHKRVWDHYIARWPDLACRIRGLASQRGFPADPHRELAMNWGYATALAGLNCLYCSTDEFPAQCQPELALDLWRRGWHRGHKVDGKDFLRAYSKSHNQADILAA